MGEEGNSAYQPAVNPTSGFGGCSGVTGRCKHRNSREARMLVGKVVVGRVSLLLSFLY